MGNRIHIAYQILLGYLVQAAWETMCVWEANQSEMKWIEIESKSRLLLRWQYYASFITAENAFSIECLLTAHIKDLLK